MNHKKLFYIVVFLAITVAISLALIFDKIAVAQKLDEEKLHSHTLYTINQSTIVKDGAQIDVGKHPMPIAINSINNKIYVANSMPDTVSVIDGMNNTVIKSIPLVSKPALFMGKPFPHLLDSISFDSINNKIYVANTGSGTVSVINPNNYTDVNTIKVGKSPTYVTVVNNPLYNATHIYVSNTGSGTVSVINPNNYTDVNTIKVGNIVGRIIVSPGELDPTIYVANTGSGTVSVIYGNKNIKNITVGNGPNYISFGFSGIYVSNTGSGTVSVINPNNYTDVNTIKVGKSPTYLTTAMDNWPSLNNYLYVANTGSGTVSVIDGKNNTVIKNIKVGNGPSSIVINPITDTIYVANTYSNTVSVIDSVANNVVARVMFDIKPFNSGYIICDKVQSPIKQYFYIYSGHTCIAKPNKGFDFLNWQKNLNGNATQIINVSSSPSAWNAFLDFFGIMQDPPEATYNITKFGSFTANFQAHPPPIPPQYWIPLYGVIISTVVGWSIPSIIGWTKSKTTVRKLNHYHKKIMSVYTDGKLDENDIKYLDKLKSEITDAHSKGKINDIHHTSLKNDLSILYEEIFEKKIKSVLSSNKDYDDKLREIEDVIIDAYSKGKINDIHYNLLKERITEYKKSF